MSAGPPGGRLRWRCRRGMKELDVLFERFLAVAGRELSSEDWRSLERLLELPDPQLAAYLLGGLEPAVPEFARLVLWVRGCGPAAAVASPPAAQA